MIYLAEWLRELVESGIVPGVRVLEYVSADDDWVEREQYWIARYSSPHLFNIRAGHRRGRRIVDDELPTKLAANAREQAKKNIGRVWVNDGAQNIWAKPDAIPPGFTRGRLHRPALMDITPGSVWITDGRDNRMLRLGEPMPETFRPGRTIRRGYQAALAYRHGSGWRGSTWITDGTSTRRLRQGEPVPDGWRAGRLDMQWITDGVRTRRLMPSMQMPDSWRRGRSLKPVTP